MLLSFILFLIGLLTTNNRTRRNISSLFPAMLSFIFLSLSIAYIGADYFTDEGINDAVIYHVIYGVEDAGIAEYYLIIIIVFILFLLSFIFSYFHYRIIYNSIHPKPKKLKAIISKVFLLSSLLIHPTIGAFWNLTPYNDSKNIELTERFLDHYRTPTIESITDKHPNFIYIYAESLERTYFDQKLFPELTDGLRQLETNNTSFFDIQQVSGTGWTVAGMTASQCGLPLVTPSGGNSMSGMDTFYDGAICMGDLLYNEGYHLVFRGGASLDFAGKGKLYKSHNFSEVSGKNELLPTLINQDYHTSWGLYDDSLMDNVFNKFLKLSASDKKFALFTLTLDTHHPNGHPSKSCDDIKYMDGSNPILNAVRCSDFILSNFIRRVQKSPYGNNTVIIISSDHLAMKNTATDLLNEGNRKNMFIVIDPNQKSTSTQVLKTGSMLDVGPTLFHTLGFQVSLGLGRNLFSEDIPLISKIDNFNTHLGSWYPEISKFWNFKKIDTDIQFNVPHKKIHIGDRNYKFPILLKLDKELASTPFFEFDKSKKLYKQLIDFDKDDSFIWVDKCHKINVLESTLNHTKYCFALGKMGGKIIGSSVDENTTIPLPDLKKLNQEKSNVALYKTRKNTLLKLSNELKEKFHEKIYRKLTEAYQKLNL